MKRELEGHIKGSLIQHQSIFNIWRNDFNNVRPHESLDMKKPKEIYINSSIKYEEFDEIVYPKKYHVRMVNDRGYVNYKGRRFFLSNAFNGFYIDINDKGPDALELWFGKMLLGDLNIKTFLFTPKLEYLIKTKPKRV